MAAQRTLPGKRETQYTMTLDMETKASGMMYVAKQSILHPDTPNLAERQTRAMQSQKAA